MNVNLVCKVGFKILAAVVAGAAVVIGIEKAVGGDKNNNSANNKGGNNNSGHFPASGDLASSRQQEGIAQQPQQSKTDMILSGVRGAGETCGRLFTLAQSISQFVESTARIFGNYQGQPNCYTPGGNSYVPAQQSFQSGNIAWVPVNGSNCILQAVPTAQNNNKW